MTDNWKDAFPKENRYFETNKGILYCENYTDIVKDFSDGSIDLVLTDPPYGISRETNFATMSNRRHRRSMYFGDWDTGIVNWKIIGTLVREGGSFITFMAFEQYNNFIKVMEQCDFDIKDRLIWEKTNPFPRNRDRRYIPNIEFIIWAVKKGAGWTFNRQNPKYETCVFRFPSESGAQFKRFHPTQKPLKLIEYLIKIHSNEFDLVLDPFIGSGTTAVACEKLNRRWIGIEINPKYCEITKERICNTQLKLL